MVRRNTNLSIYVKSRKEKYSKQKIPCYLVHVSLAPRKILYPNITPFAWEVEDHERAEPLLFLSPAQDISNWFGWCYYKKMKKVNTRGFSILYLHIVRPKKKSLFIPTHRYRNEFVSRCMLKPIAIVPIRYYPEFDFADLYPLSKKLKILKNLENKSFFGKYLSENTNF